MNKKLIIGIAISFSLLFALSVVLSAGDTANFGYKPKEGYVPNAETAIKIAVAVWTPVYGKETIEAQKPYKAILKKGIWHITGSLPKGVAGGVAEARISKDDGRILRIIHGK